MVLSIAGTVGSEIMLANAPDATAPIATLPSSSGSHRRGHGVPNLQHRGQWSRILPLPAHCDQIRPPNRSLFSFSLWCGRVAVCVWACVGTVGV